MTDIHYAFIPARGGSIGVPGKNIRLLRGKPLIEYTLDFAEKSNFFTKIIVSTDSGKIAEIASKNLVSVGNFEKMLENSVKEVSDTLIIHKRLQRQAETLSPIREVLFDLARRDDVIGQFDFLWMLQPTSPFKHPSDLLKIRSLFDADQSWSCISSFTSIGGMHPDRMYKRGEGNYLEPYIHQANQDNKPRQLLSELFIKDGAFYIFKKLNLVQNILMGDKVLPYFRDGLQTINIDTLNDFKIAELIENPYENDL